MRAARIRTAWLVGLLLLAGCGSGDGGSAAGPESVCGGRVASQPQLCHLLLQPSVVPVGGTFEPDFGLADLEGDIVAVCPGIAPGASDPFESCFGVDPIGETANGFFVITPGFPAVDTAGADLGPGSYLVSFAVVDSFGQRSNTVTATLVVNGLTPTPTPTPVAPAPLGPSNIWFDRFVGSENYEVFVTNTDGLVPTRLTDTIAWVRDRLMDVSLDGRLVLFVSTRDEGIDEVYVMNGDGTHQRPLTSGTRYVTAHHDAVFNPDARLVAWHYDRDIWVMNTDGSGTRRLTDNPYPASHFYPRFTPDGTAIVYVSDGRVEGPGIYLVDLDGHERRLGPRTGEVAKTVGFTADGSAVLFTNRYGTTGGDLWTARLDGGGASRIAELPGFRGDAAVSPDRARLAYTADRGGGSRVYIRDLVGGGEWCATCGASLGNDRTPAFSPDGLRLVYASYSPFSSDLYVVDVDGANPLLLTEGPDVFGYYDSGPIWR